MPIKKMFGGIKTGGTETGAGVGDRVIAQDAGVQDADVNSSLSGDSSHVAWQDPAVQWPWVDT